MKSKLTWTDKQREIAELAGQNKTFVEITDLGYSKNMTSRVLTALKEGQKPEPKPEPGTPGTEPGGAAKPLVSGAAPKVSPIIFRVASREISLDPLELNRQYQYYLDLAKDDGMNYSFSEILTIGIQLVWVMSQDIPITANLLTALFYGYQ
jgi:hypothetical protein